MNWLAPVAEPGTVGHYAHSMNYSALVTIGTIGSLLFIGHSTIRGCRAGHAPMALLGGLVVSILAVDLWAVAPLQLKQKSSHDLVLWLLWLAAIFPYLALIYRLFPRDSQKKADSGSRR